jgi:hypothetical protein
MMIDSHTSVSDRTIAVGAEIPLHISVTRIKHTWVNTTKTFSTNSWQTY